MLKGNASEIKALVYSKVNCVNLSVMYNKSINVMEKKATKEKQQLFQVDFDYDKGTTYHMSAEK